MDIDEIDQRVYDAISTLTGISVGDVYHRCMDGELVELAIQALILFVEKHHLLEDKEDTPPVDDLTILEGALADAEAELEKTKDRSERRTLRSSIASLRHRINLERDLQRSH